MLVTFTVTTNATHYWLTVDNTDLDVAGGGNSLDLAPGQHALLWWTSCRSTPETP